MLDSLNVPIVIVILLLKPILMAFLIGSIPFAYIIAKLNGIDIRKAGSGNPGASNVLRCCGKGAGILAYICDIGKGMVAVVAVYYSLPNSTPQMLEYLAIATTLPIDFKYYLDFILVVSGFVSVLGHVFSVFLKFKGGKGVATSCGVMFILAPVALLITMVFFFIGLFASKRVMSVASTTGAAAFPLVLTFMNFFTPQLLAPFFNIGYKFLLPIAILVLLFIVIKHIPNYKRLVAGNENTFSKK